MLVGNFLDVLGVTLIFATDMHHLVIAALNDSYTLFAPGEMMPIAATSPRCATHRGRRRVPHRHPAVGAVPGVRPLFNLGLGVLSRLMPQMQVFFVGMPLSILVGFLILRWCSAP